MESSYLPALKIFVNYYSEFFLILYLAFQICDQKMLEWSIKCLFISGFICMTGIYLEKIFHFDFYYFFTNGRRLLLPNRMRGFTFEPRAAAQYMSYLFIILLSTSSIRTWQLLITLPLVATAFIFAKSMSGFVLMSSGIILMFLAMLLIKSPTLKRSSIITFIFLICGTIYFNTSVSRHIKKYLGAKSYVVYSKKFSSHFEYADGAGVEFFIQNPNNLILGAGTGQSSIATSKYVIPARMKKFPKGLDYRPLMGLVLGLINGGLVLVLCKLLLLYLGIKHIRHLAMNLNHLIYKDIFVYFICIFGMYFLQVRYAHVFAWALGLMATLHNNKSVDKETSQT